MGCSNCGQSNCLGCAQQVANSNVVLTPVSAGVRACSPLANCTTAQGTGCTSVTPATPAPYYNCAPSCPEDHCQQIYIAQLATAICTLYAFNIPACGETANLYFTDLKILPIGSYLWNANYGYFEVVAFNHQTGLVTVLNQCNEGNASVGTNVPACTCFVVAPAPTIVTDPDFFPFVAVDFTAPAVGNCVDITVTSVAGLNSGDVVAIGSGFYSISAIVSPSVITICNDGDGITPGTAVIAKNGAGEFQYPIIVSSNCCNQMTSAVDHGVTVSVSGDITAVGAQLDSNTLTFVINNPSATRTMNVFVVYHATLLTGDVNPGTVVVDLRILEAVNGGSAQTLEIGPSAISNDSAVFTAYGHHISASAVHTITPGGTLTLASFSRVIHSGTPAVEVAIANIYIRASVIAVAL